MAFSAHFREAFTELNLILATGPQGQVRHLQPTGHGDTVSSPPRAAGQCAQPSAERAPGTREAPAPPDLATRRKRRSLVGWTERHWFSGVGWLWTWDRAICFRFGGLEGLNIIVLASGRFEKNQTLHDIPLTLQSEKS